MAIVKKMIDKMGGTISVTSEVGKGSTFVVELPFEMGAAPEKSKKEEADKENSIHGLNLMLVEDNELNREIATAIMKEIDNKVLDYMGYVFMYYKIQKLLDRGIELTPEEIEKIDQMMRMYLELSANFRVV